jgi:hypothetical protein
MEQPNVLDTEQTLPLEINQRDEFIALLKKQNETMNYNLITNMVKDDDNRFVMRTQIMNFDMSPGAMIGFMFEWGIASIPVGIVLGSFWLFFLTFRF